jgi:hypothetical protein
LPLLSFKKIFTVVATTIERRSTRLSAIDQSCVKTEVKELSTSSL